MSQRRGTTEFEDLHPSLLQDTEQGLDPDLQGREVIPEVLPEVSAGHGKEIEEFKGILELIRSAEE